MTPLAATAANRGSHRNAPSSTRNSPTNPFRLGRPIDDSVMIRNTAVRRGTTAFRPPYSAINRVWRRSDSMPTTRKSPPVLTPCAIIWYTAPCRPLALSAQMPRTTKPRWLTDEYATSFFMSGCTIATSAP